MMRDLTFYSRAAILDILGLIFASTVLSSYLFPVNSFIWVLIIKIVELLGVCFAAIAIMLMWRIFKRQHELIIHRIESEKQARESKETLPEFLKDRLKVAAKKLEMFFNTHGLSTSCTYSNSDLCILEIIGWDYPIERIELRVIDYHLWLWVVFKDESYLTCMTCYLKKGELKLYLENDRTISHEKLPKIYSDIEIQKTISEFVSYVLSPTNNIFIGSYNVSKQSVVSKFACIFQREIFNRTG